MLGLACLAFVVVTLLAVSSATGRASAATAVPYADPHVVGSIGLCNQAGQQVTSGSVDTVPFAWRAVSTQPAGAPYDNAGRRATLVVYQPLQNIPAGDWSGETLTAASSYTNPANPMAAGTGRDQSLEDVIEAFPPAWDGFLELRIYLSTTNAPPYSTQYPALNVQVTGGMWHAIGGATVNCASGTAESMETVLLPSTTTTTPTATSAPTTTGPPKTTAPATTGRGGGKSTPGRGAAGAGAGGQGGSGTGGPGGAKSGSGAGTSGGRTSGPDPHANGEKSAAASDVAASSSTPTTSDGGLIAGVTVAALLVLGLSGYLLVRRRRSAAPPDPDVNPGPTDPGVSPGPTDLPSSTMKGH
jgi:MYXO-CTERM domain-containing protein